MEGNARGDLVIRLLLASAMMAAALWYLSSLWNARMRDQNLILIYPVVIAMLPFYLSVVLYEVRRYRRITAGSDGLGTPRASSYEHIGFMVVAAAGVGAFYLFGGIPATVGILAGGLLVLGVRQPLPLILIPPGVTLALWLVFIKGFGIRMPLWLAPW